MYPHEIIFGMDLYAILLLVGVIVCMVFIRLLSDRRGMRAKWFNFCLYTALGAVTVGYGGAVLLQSFYNWLAGKPEASGATFYGGLIGGVLLFVAVYFGLGHFLFPDGYHIKNFRVASDIAAPCITVAHGFGRLGCLMAGCCYGKACSPDAWYGIYMAQAGGTVIPVQLYEALFLLALSGVLLWLYKKEKKYQMPTYMIAYAVWRFIAEMLRDDDRGATVVDFLTPSQLISVLLLAGGVALLVVEILMDRRRAKTPIETPAEAPTETADEGEAV